MTGAGSSAVGPAHQGDRAVALDAQRPQLVDERMCCLARRPLGTLATDEAASTAAGLDHAECVAEFTRHRGGRVQEIVSQT